MKQAVLVVDVQPSFDPPDWLVERCQKLASRHPSVATVFRHDETRVPFERQLGWRLEHDGASLVRADHVLIKYGYGPTAAVLERLRNLRADRVLVCGIQADACVLACGFALFDAGLRPALVADAVVGSSLDPAGTAVLDLWRHHLGAAVESYRDLV
ncbi:MAG: isochorismatase family protein [Pseudomonadota bacterium]